MTNKHSVTLEIYASSTKLLPDSFPLFVHIYFVHLCFVFDYRFEMLGSL